MAKVSPITEQFQHFVSELKESFWGDLQGQVQQSIIYSIFQRFNLEWKTRTLRLFAQAA